VVWETPPAVISKLRGGIGVRGGRVLWTLRGIWGVCFSGGGGGGGEGWVFPAYRGGAPLSGVHGRGGSCPPVLLPGHGWCTADCHSESCLSVLKVPPPATLPSSHVFLRSALTMPVSREGPTKHPCPDILLGPPEFSSFRLYPLATTPLSFRAQGNP